MERLYHEAQSAFSKLSSDLADKHIPKSAKALPGYGIARGEYEFFHEGYLIHRSRRGW
jgi:hypothetical protein